MFQTFRLLSHDNRGMAALEYALIAALIAVASVGAMTKVGKRMTTTFRTVARSL